MTILETVDRAAVGHMLIAVIIIAGRVALDRMVPRGRFATRRAGEHYPAAKSDRGR
jgi:hypothetical protein